MQCQSGCGNQAIVEIESERDDFPYRLCGPCAARVNSGTLRPLEWYNLAVIHSLGELQFHDRYDHDGVATNPRRRVIDAHLFPSPRLADVQHSLTLLMDYCHTRRVVREQEFEALRAFDPELVHSEIERRLSLPEFVMFQTTYVQIAAAIPSSRTRGWYREILDGKTGALLQYYLESGRGILPPEECFDRGVRDAAKTPKDVWRWAVPLAKVGDPRFVAWLQANLCEPITGDWGLAAARARVEWPLLREWLEGGRPFSLVAIDALHWYFEPDSLLPRMDRPASVRGERVRTEIAEVLRAYVLRDPVPRVERTIGSVLQGLERPELP